MQNVMRNGTRKTAKGPLMRLNAVRELYDYNRWANQRGMSA